MHLTLLGYDDTTATYQIRLTQDGTPPTEAKITVKRDGRGLLGGRDGVAAPYFVLHWWSPRHGRRPLARCRRRSSRE